VAFRRRRDDTSLAVEIEEVVVVEFGQHLLDEVLVDVTGEVDIERRSVRLFQRYRLREIAHGDAPVSVVEEIEDDLVLVVRGSVGGSGVG